MAALYSDRFVEIFEDHLQIKGYYFPFGAKKRVDLKEGVTFRTDAELGLHFFEKKGWGLATNNIWWAQDRCREFSGRHQSVVVTVKQQRFRKGFSVEDDVAIELLSELVKRTPL